MANQNFRVKKGLEVGVGATVVFVDGNGIGINNNTPQTGNVDVNKHVRLQQTLEATGFSTFTGDVLIDSDLTVTGIASYTQLDAEQSQIGVLTAKSSYLGFTTIGVASVGFATLTDIVVGNGTYTGINTFTGTIFANDLSIAGVVTASEGNFIFTNLQGENILFLGVGTIAQLGVNTFSASLSTLGIVGIETSLDVNGITTLGTADPVTGFVTTRGDLYVGGDLYVQDDIKYDEISGRNLSISGIATINTLGVTTDASIGKDLTVTDDVFIGRDLDVVGIATVGVLSTAEARIDDAAIGVATIARYLNVAGVTTLAGIVTTGDDTYVGKDLYVAGNLDLSGDIRLEDIFARNLVVSGVATFTSGVTTFLDAENINAGVSTIGIASVGFATVADGYTGVSTVNDIYVENLLYDSNSNVGLADSILATAGGKLVWTRPDLVGVATGFDPGNTIYVTTTGDDNNSGISREKPVLTIEQALTLATSGTIIEIAAGNYVENFPLTVPAGVTIKGAGQRATYVSPATTGVDGFLMNDASTVEQLTIGGFLKNGAENYTFKYETGAAITTRSPYVSQVTVLNKGSKTSPTDLYGYNSNDNPTLEYRSANGVLADGSVLDASTTIPGFLVNEVTIFAPAARGIVMTNGARVEMVASFIYFAEAGIVGETDLGQGLSGSGRTRLSLENASTTPSAGNTLQYFDSDGSTVLASGTIDEVSGGYVYLNGSGTGEFKVPRNRQPKRVNFVDSSTLNTAIKKFGTASLDCTVSNTDGITVDSSEDFGFGTGDFTIEFWLYRTSNLNNTVLFDLRDTSDTDSAISIHGNGGDALSVYIGNTLTLSGSTGVALNTWTQVAVSRQGTSLRLFIEGSLDASATSSDDLGTARPLHLGDSYAESSSGAALYDELRITKGAAKYTSNFTPSSVALRSDENTSILLHFDGINGATETTDDVLTYQDIRFNGNTADRISLSDYSEFGCDLRSASSAVEYGNRGVVGEGAGAQMRLISLNFNHVGALGDITNDFRDANKSNEVVNVDGAAKIAYVSIDELGDFRVGDAFYVNQATGQVSFDNTTNDLTSLTSLTITDGVNNSVITPTSGRFGQVLISGNTVESVSGDINIAAAGGADINLIGDTNVTGILTASSIRADALQNFDTFIALDDSGVNDGTIRLATDNVEGMRIDNQQRVGIKTQTVRADLDVVGQTQLEDLEVTGVTTTTHLAVGVAATIGFATITDAYIGVATFSDVDINDVGVGVATIAYADITDAVIGVATIGYADITDGFVAIATITDANIGVATIAYSDTTDAQAGVLTVTGISTFQGEAVFESNVLIDADLTITGSQNAKSFGAEFLSVTGVATVAFSTTTDAYIGVATIGYSDTTDAAIGVATIGYSDTTDAAIGVATIGYSDTTDAAIGVATIGYSDTTDALIGVATVGFATLTDAAVGGALTVYGDLDVVGDITYDEVSGRNLSISGIATIGDLEVERDLDVGQNLDVVGIATVGVLSTSSALIGIATVGVITAKDGFFETITFGSSGGGGGGGGGGTGINSESVRTGNLYVSGIATITTGIVTDLTVEIATIEDEVVGASTITYANITDAAIGVATVGLQTVTNNLFVGDKFSVVGTSSFFADVFVDGNINVTGSQNVESFGAVNLEVTGIATITDADITDARVGVATIGLASVTTAEVTTAGVYDATVAILTAEDSTLGAATVTYADITDALVGVETVGYADITDASVGVATILSANIGVATVTGDLTVEGNLNVTGDISYDEVSGRNLNISGVGTIQQLGVSTFAAIDAAIGVATIGYADVTDAAIGVLTVTTASVTGDLTVEGNFDLTGDVTVDELTARNLDVTGVGTITNLGVTSFTATDSTLGVATITTADITDATVDFADIVDARAGVLTVTGISSFQSDVSIVADVTIDGNLNISGSQNVQSFGAVDLEITGIATIATSNVTDSAIGVATIGYSDITDLNVGVATVALLEVSSASIGVATVTGDLTVEGNLNVTGDISYDEVSGRNLNITGVGTITNLGVTSFTATDSTLGVATITAADIDATTIEFANITEETVGISTIGYVDITDALVGVATITAADIDATTIEFANITDATIGVATVGLASVTELEVSTIVGYSATFTDFKVTGAVSLPGIPVQGGDAEFRNLNITGLSSFAGLTTFSDNVFVDGNLTVSGIRIEETVAGENLLVTGIATIVSGIFTSIAVSELSTLTDAGIGVATIGYADITDAQVGVLTITTGFVTGDLTIEGNVNVTGDISYDEVTGKNISISGVGTINQLGVNTFTAVDANIGVATVGYADVTDLVAGIATITDANIGVATVGYADITDELVGVSTIGFATVTDGFIGVLTATTVEVTGNLEVQGDFTLTGDTVVDELTARNLDVTGIGTIAVLEATDADLGVATVGYTDVTDSAIGVATIGYANVTDLNVGVTTTQDLRVGGATTMVGDLTVQGSVNVTGDIVYDEVTGRNINISGVGTINQLGVNTFTAVDATVGVLTVTTAEITTLTAENTTIDVLDSIDVNVSGAATVVGNLTVQGDFELTGDVVVDEVITRNLNVSGVGTISELETSVLSAIDASIGVATVTYSVLTNTSIGLATITDASIGVATVTGDLTVEGNLNVTGDISYDEVSGRNLNISGVGTISQLGVSTFAAADASIGVATITTADIENVDAETLLVNTDADITEDVRIGRNLEVTGFTTFSSAEGVALTVSDLVVSGIATLNGAGIATEGGDVDFNNISVGVITATTGNFSYIDTVDVNVSGAASVGLASVTDLEFTTGNGFELEVQSLTVPDGGFVSLPGIPVSGGSATFAELSVTGVSTFGGIATFTNDVYVDGDLFVTGDQVFEGASAVNLTVSGVLTATNLVSTGIQTFSDTRIEDATIAFADVTDLNAGVATIGVANVTDSVTGVATITSLDNTNATIGFITATNAFIGVATVQDLNSLSDRRVKENIRNIEKPLEKIDRINGVKFDFVNSGKKSMGVIAQEVEQVFPELIAGTFPKSVNYNGLIGLLIESVKELKQQNETMQAEIEKLKNK